MRGVGGETLSDLVMQIAAMSMAMKSAEVTQAVQTSVLKKALDTSEQQATSLLEQLLPAPTSMPGVGERIDVRA